jgi:hypothetical protein
MASHPHREFANAGHESKAAKATTTIATMRNINPY